MRTYRPAQSLALAALLAVACSDPTGPGSINGRYTLRLVGGQPLPWLSLETRTTDQLGSVTVTIRQYIDGATLVLLEPERDTLRMARRTITIPDGGTPDTTAAVVQVPYRLDGDRNCPADVYEFFELEGACEGRPKVPRRGDSLFIELPAYASGQRATFTFVREGR